MTTYITQYVEPLSRLSILKLLSASIVCCCVKALCKAVENAGDSHLDKLNFISIATKVSHENNKDKEMLKILKFKLNT